MEDLKIGDYVEVLNCGRMLVGKIIEVRVNKVLVSFKDVGDGYRNSSYLISKCKKTKRVLTEKILTTIVRNVISNHLLVFGDFDYPENLLTKDEIEKLNSICTNISMEIKKYVYNSEKTSVKEIVEDVLQNGS